MLNVTSGEGLSDSDEKLDTVRPRGLLCVLVCASLGPAVVMIHAGDASSAMAERNVCTNDSGESGGSDCKVHAVLWNWDLRMVLPRLLRIGLGVLIGCANNATRRHSCIIGPLASARDSAASIGERSSVSEMSRIEAQLQALAENFSALRNAGLARGLVPTATAAQRISQSFKIFR